MVLLAALSTLTSGTKTQDRTDRHNLSSPLRPLVTPLSLLRDKKKKGQQERDRQANIQSQNLIMLQHLSDIASSKRVDDGNLKKANWNDFYLQIIVNPR